MSPARLRAAATAVLVVALAVVGGLPAVAAGTGPGAPTTNHDDPMPVDVTVTAVTPQVLSPGDDLVLTLELEHTGTEPIARPRVFVHLDGRREFISRTSLDRWRDADPDDPLGPAVVTVDLPAPLTPGTTTTVTATVPAASLDLSSRAAAWGPRAVGVQLVDADDSARPRLGVARTFALWFPPQEVTATRLSVLAPVVGPPVDPHAETWVAELEELTGPGGRLAALVAATGDHPEVTWVLDPWLVDAGTGPDGAPAAGSEPDREFGAAPGSGDADADDVPGDDGGPTATPTAGPTPDPTDPPTTGPTPDPEAEDDAPAGPLATAWVAQLLRGVVDRDLVLTPYGDTDWAALAHAGTPDLLRLATSRSAEAARATALPDSAGVTLAWPARDLPDVVTAGFAAVGDERAVVVGPDALPVPGVLTYTPTGRTTVATSAGDVTVLVPDGRLSQALLTGRVEPPAEGGTDADGDGDLDTGSDRDDEPADEDAPAAAPTGPPSPAEAAQDLIAELAVITRERPSDARHVLATVPRDWHPDVDVVRAQLDALEAAPWVRTEPVAALVGAPDPGVDRGTLPARVPAEREVSQRELAAVQDSVEERRALAGMVPEPDRLLQDLEAEVLALASIAWRADPAGRAAIVERSAARTLQVRQGVGVVPGSTVLLVSPTGDLPVRVRNDLDQPVTVQVALRPDDRRLVADAPVDVTIEPGGEELVQIGVHAVSSADVRTAVVIRTPDGVLVDDATTMVVRVRAEWEGIGAAVIGALLAVGLVLGLVRTIRRGRTARRAAPVASGPDALSPEAEEV